MEPSPYLGHAFEHVGRQMDAGGLEALAGLRTHAGRAEPADDLPLLRDAELLEQEDLLHRDHVAFHAGDLGNADDLAGAVAHARLLTEDLVGSGDMLAIGG